MDVNIQKFTKMFARQAHKGNKRSTGKPRSALGLVVSFVKFCVEVCDGYSDCTGHAAGK